MEKKLWIGNLYAFYGQLLTARQQEVLELYSLEDLSLGEISEQLGITRQAVHDMIRRAAKSLEEYEEKLGLYGRFEAHREQLREVNHALGALRGSLDSDHGTLDDIIRKVNQLID